MKNEALKTVEEVLPKETVYYEEPMSNHTTFRIGGPADLLVTPRTKQELKKVLLWACDNRVPVTVIGAGSNLLVRDGGIRGLVVKLGPLFSHVTVEGSQIRALSGALLADLAITAAERGLSGLEFAEGIPGTLGGAIYMNAGAYDSEMSDLIQEVTVMSRTGQIKLMGKEEICFGYRTSSFQGSDDIIVEAVLQLKPADRVSIITKMKDYSARRKAKQPLEWPSAGSVFKRPKGHYVGPLIEKLGLKGYRIGDAEISAKHAGFIVNVGKASARDVLALISLVQDKAKEVFGVELVPEIRIIGED